MDTKHDVLKVVSGKISDDAYCSLTQMNGFQFPNDEISVIQIIRCIEKARFPTSPKYEYAYAINACGQDDLRRVDPCCMAYQQYFYIATSVNRLVRLMSANF